MKPINLYTHVRLSHVMLYT